MAKRKYRLANFKAVDWAQLSAATDGGVTRLAVDVAKKDFVAQLEDAHGERLALLKWKHPQDTRALLDVLLAHVDASRLEVILEPTGTYGDPLRWQFEQAGAKVFKVSPKHVHDARELFDGVPSLHDGKAAGIIAELHRSGRSRRWTFQDTQRRDQKAALKRLRAAQGRQQETLNHLEAALARHWPEVGDLMDLTRCTLHALLEQYGTPAAMAADPAGARALMRQVGGPGLSEAKMDALLASAAATLGVPCSAQERMELHWLAADLRALHEEIRTHTQAVEALVEDHETLLHWGSAIGKVTAAALFVSLGDPQHYAHARMYQKSAGLNLKIRQSGKFSGQLKLTKRGPGLARHFLFMAVLRWIQKDPLAKRWYDAKVGREGGQRKLKAVVALMRKLLKGLWASAQQGEPFDSRKLFAPTAAG